MPRTAANREANTSKRERPARPQPMQTVAPILFRLPQIPDEPVDYALTPSESDVPQEDVPESPELPVENEERPTEGVAVKTGMLQAAPVPPPVVRQPVSEHVSQSRLATETIATAELEDERSWWEHWSSGVVLILLIIALVTASIIAFNDSQPDPEMLADVEPSRELEELDIPRIELPPVPEAPAMAAPSELVDQASETETGKSLATKTSNETQQQESLIPDLDFPATQETPATPTETATPHDLVATAPTGAPAVPNVTEPQVADPTMTDEQQLTTKLQKPEPTGQVVLFPELPGKTGKGLAESAVPGASPDFYDGAASQAMTNEIVTDTQLPDYASLLSGTPPMAAESVAPSASTSATTVSHQKPLDVNPSEAKSNAVPMQSATPDMDVDALIRVYQEMRQLQRQQSSPQNHYRTAPGTATVPMNPSATTPR